MTLPSSETRISIERDASGADRLDRILRPRSIAVVGASRSAGTIGHQILANLVRYGFRGPVYPVNPHASSVCSIHAYPDLAALPEVVDLAVIAVPKSSVVSIVEQCGRVGTGGVVVISAGFQEVGGEGIERERQLVETARHSGVRLIGPNCLGVLNADPAVSMNATFAPSMPPAGGVAFVSQSGALGLSILDSAREYGIGIAQFVSIGNRADVSSNDLLAYWHDDPTISAILMYVESFGNPNRFLELAQEVARRKPVIVMTSGRSKAGARAAASHTGALASDNQAVDALLAQAGVLRAETIEELFDLAQALGTGTLPQSRRTAVITNSGGPGILAADALEASGLELPLLSATTITRLRSLLPEEASVQNPVDMIASARAESYRATLDAVLADPEVDSAIAIFVPPIATRQLDVAAAIAQAKPAHPDKPLLAVLMGHADLAQARAELQHGGIPTYVFPEPAAQALAAMARQAEQAKRPVEPIEILPVRADIAKEMVAAARGAAHSMLLGTAALELLDAYGIPTAAGRLVKDPDAAVDAAVSLGYPVALKIVSQEIPHKTEVGGVRVGLKRPEDVRWAFAEIVAAARRAVPAAKIDGIMVQRMAAVGRELIVGMARDPSFGPLVMFGLGGIYANALRDVVFRLAPLRRSDAAGMVRGIRGFRLLEAFRGTPAADLTALEDLLLRISQLAVDLPEIGELDLNPVLASKDGAVVADARMVFR